MLSAPRRELIFLFLVGTIPAVVTLWISGFGEAMEDAAIHLAMAKDLWSEGFFSLTIGTPAGAVTSPLWVFLESIPLVFTGGTTETVTFMGLFTTILFTWNLWSLLSYQSKEIAAFTVVLTLLSGPIQWHLWSGMETLLFGAFILGALDGIQREKYRAFGVWSALAILTRMEGILLMGAPLWILIKRRQDPTTELMPITRSLLFPVAAFGLFGMINWFHTDHFMPTTGDGKRFLYGIHLHGLDALVILPSRMAILLEDWAYFIYGAFAKNGNPVLFWLSVAIAPAGAGLLWFHRNKAAFWLFAWCTIITVIYAIELPVRDVAGRYQALHLLILPLTAGAAIAGAKRLHPALGLLLFTLMTAQTSLTLSPWAQARHTQMQHLQSVHREAGKWIAENNNACHPIILGEIGWISFENKREVCSPPIRDYYALADPEYFKDASKGRALSAAIKEGENAIFALSMLSVNFPSIHLNLSFPEGDPGTWKVGQTYEVKENKTGERFLFRVEKRFSYTFPEVPEYHHPAGRITGMNPIIVGVVKAL